MAYSSAEGAYRVLEIGENMPSGEQVTYSLARSSVGRNELTAPYSANGAFPAKTNHEKCLCLCCRVPEGPWNANIRKPED